MVASAETLSLSKGGRRSVKLSLASLASLFPDRAGRSSARPTRGLSPSPGPARSPHGHKSRTAGVSPVKQGDSFRSPAVQEWLPVRDLAGDYLIRSDGHLVMAIRVEPIPFNLLSVAEQGRRIKALDEVFHSVSTSLQFSIVARPIDLDAYIRSLDETLAGTGGARRQFLRGYSQFMRQLVAGGGATERRYYLLIEADGKHRDAPEELRRRAGELVGNLAKAGLSVQLCDDRDLLDLQFTFLHPVQAAFERPDWPSVTTIYRPVDGADHEEEA